MSYDRARNLKASTLMSPIFSLFRLLCICVIAASVIACASDPAQNILESATDPLTAGIMAFKDGSDDMAWAMLLPIAEQRVAKAERYIAIMLSEDRAPENYDAGTRQRLTIEYFLKAAQSGDNYSLVRLEALREATPSQTLTEQIIAVEKARATAGDAMLAWRLARRYREGDGTTIDPKKEEKWLRQVARTPSFLHTDDAANRLCELHSDIESQHKSNQAISWCSKAAKNGNAAAAITLARMKSK
jgi:TPR repeat protein